MITKMTKYTFLLLSSDTDAILREIQELGVLDITRSRKPVDTTSAQLFREAEAIRHEIETIEKCDFSRDERHSAIEAKLTAAQAAVDEKRHWGDLDPAKIKALRDAGCQIHYYTLPVKKFNPAWLEQYPIAEIDRDEKTVRFVLIDRASEGANNFQVKETHVARESIEQLDRNVKTLQQQLLDRESEMEKRFTRK